MSNPDRQSLYLLRHAKAEPWVPGINDFKRILSDRGNHHVQRLTHWAAGLLDPPEVVLCSPSARTRGTLAPFTDAWPTLRDITHYLPEIYDATSGMLRALAEEGFAATDSLMIIGHNPGFEYLALGVMRDEDAAGITKMPTGTLAVIDFENGWLQDSGRGVLRHWIRRKDLTGL